MSQARLKGPHAMSGPMQPTPDSASKRDDRGGRRARRIVVLLFVLACLFAAATQVHAAQPFIWDQDTNGIDDRMESVHLLGYSASFELGDTTQRQRIQVQRSGGDLLYGVYVIWTHTPTPSDVAALALLGMPVLTRIEAVPASRSLATFAQVAAAAALPGVQRVEAIPLLYPETRDGAAAIGVRDASNRVFPTLATTMPGHQGHGVVVAFLDSGINDQAEGSYPGHEALAGRCLGGALFISADSLSQTPKNGTVNPADHGGQATHSHATHVGAIAVGSGSAGGYAAGVAPLAKYVDVKVLNDSGNGVALPEALDWCISNRNRDWGSPDPAERGIQVINLSLSSPDASDGQDLASRLAAKAVEQGIVVVASMGNGGLAGHVPSPAAGDGVIAVGAWDIARTPQPDDDSYPDFNNTGPRASDGDADMTDEDKPDVLAPGVNVLSANGDLLTDGTKWQRLSGTSMAAAFVSGVCALLREQAPTASPATIAEWLRLTARRPLPGAPAGTTGVDPRWTSTRGCGLVDAYAAMLEASASPATQLRRLAMTGTDLAVQATLWTGREFDIANVVFERAPDVGGAPGVFAPVDSLPASGGSSIEGATSVHEYARSWNVPVPERGERFWYRAAVTQSGHRYTTPGVEFTSPGGPRVATIGYTIVHDAFDSDLELNVRAGYPTDGGPVMDLPGTSAAVASDWVDGSSVTGDQSWTFSVPVPDGPASPFLPPSSGNPWTLNVHEGGSITRSGRITDFRVLWNGPSGLQTYAADNLPQQTVEGSTTSITIPSATTDVAGPPAFRGARAAPNPARSGRPVHFAFARREGAAVHVFDISGREVAAVALAPAGEGWQADWLARDAAGRPLPAGIYLVRGGANGRTTRLVLLGP